MVPLGVSRRARGLAVLGAELHEHLAEVLSLEEAEEGARGVLQALDDGLLVLETPGLDPGAGLAQELGVAVEVIADDEALHADAIADHLEEVARPRLGRVLVVL